MRRSTALLAALALVALPLPAQAHDELTGSDPEDGATVEAGELDELTLTFSGAVAEVGAAVSVTDPDGGSALDGEPEVEGTEVTQDLVDDLADGDYAVAWRVTSEDGHPISGEFGFTVTGGDEEDTEEASPAPTPSEEPQEETSEEAEPTESSTGQEADETTPEQTDDAASEDATSADSATTGASSGLPVWAWVLLAAGGVGVLALMAATWQRGRR
ncbi:hypothetical protein GCM10025788_01140 [Serinicoccus chungangensis]